MNKEEKKVIKKETVKGNSMSRTKKTSVSHSIVNKNKKDKVIINKDMKNEGYIKPNTLDNNGSTELLKEVIIEKKVGFNVIEVVLIMIITLLFGGLAGGFIGYVAKGNMSNQIVDGVKMPEEFSEFLQIYNTIKNEYFEEVDTTKMLEAGIKGMVQFLGDPFSNYLDPKESSEFNERLEGKYVGIGAEVAFTKDNTHLVSRLLENSAAGNAGVLVGDQFLRVEGQDVTSMNLTELSKLLKGPEGTNVIVTFKRGEEEKEITIVRRHVDIDSVSSKIIERDGKKIGFISIDIFAANTFTQFERELLKIQNDIDGVIIDVRDNTGGHLNVVEQIASLFITKGEIIYQLETKGVKQPVYSTRTTDIKLPVVVLMNANSASASEILATALSESYGATLVGNKTYGKGTVQTTKELSNGSTIKYTFQKWLTPKGNWIHEKGVNPDTDVNMNEAFYQNPSLDTDNQLQTAIDIVLKK